MKEYKPIIEGVLRTLDQITVNGRNNLDMLLGCIIALEGLLNTEEVDSNGQSMDGR